MQRTTLASKRGGGVSTHVALQEVVLVASVRLAQLVTDLVHLLPAQRRVPYIHRLPEAHCARHPT
jgi:hypothetical protein